VRDKFHREILMGSPRAGASNKGGVGKISHFLPLSVYISQLNAMSKVIRVHDILVKFCMLRWVIFDVQISFSALTLLVGCHKGPPACRNMCRLLLSPEFPFRNKWRKKTERKQLPRFTCKTLVKTAVMVVCCYVYCSVHFCLILC